MTRLETHNLSRRALLFGRPQTDPSEKQLQEHHLPWALGSAIEQCCTGCAACLDACPENVIVISSQGFAKVDFSKGECVFCELCAEACHEPVFAEAEARDQMVPWVGNPTIDASCLAEKGVVCEICKDQCPESAIKFPPQLGAVSKPSIDKNVCTACGACVSTCPVTAVEIVFEEAAGGKLSASFVKEK